MNFISLNADSIDQEHICCAISDEKSNKGYQCKKNWLKKQFSKGYQFYRLNERAKVFIEYGPTENAWVPVSAPNTLAINCFWVSGKYKKQGLAKKLLERVKKDQIKQNKEGIITIAGAKKFHFMSDGKWFQKQGFEILDTTDSGFLLLGLGKFSKIPSFLPSVKQVPLYQKGLVAYYSDRCPYTMLHVETSLKQTAEIKNIPLKIIKLKSQEEAQNCPSPGTVFSLFYNGQFITTDISACLNSRFDKLVLNP